MCKVSKNVKLGSWRKLLDIWCVHNKLEKKNWTKNIGSGKKIVKDKLLYFLILWESPQNLWYWLRLLSAASVCFYLNCQSNSISKYVNFIVCKENSFCYCRNLRESVDGQRSQTPRKYSRGRYRSLLLSSDIL